MTTAGRYVYPGVNVLDIRDVIERIEGLESIHKNCLAEKCSEECEYVELQDLSKLMEALALAGNGGDEQWRGMWYPLTLIEDSYFGTYVEGLAEDIHGDEVTKASWPFNCIDWIEAAKLLQNYYTSIEYDSYTYWYR